MKKRIEQLLNGIFEYEQAEMIISPEEISVTAVPGAVVRGSFRLEAENEKRFRGFLYTSSPRVVCEPVEFQGISNEIHYQIDCSGYEDGMISQEHITICSDLGEYTVPVIIKAEEKTQEENELPFDSIEAFTELCQKDYQKAYRCFLSERFAWMLRRTNEKAFCLYEGLGKERNYETLEEFLTGMGYKDPVVFSVERTSIEMHGLSEPVRETIVVTKNTWGFEKIRIESDARFLRPEKKILLTDEFAGRSFDLNVILDTNLMHAGRNYVRLTLSTLRQKVEIEITVTKDTKQRNRQGHICKIMRKKLEGLYIDFRLKKIDLSTWIAHSSNVINSYKRAGGDDVFADLFQVQLLFADGKKQKALELLESLEEQKHRFNTSERYGFYLYMSTFFYQEASYVDRVEEEINRLFLRDKTNWKLQWILLYLQESYLKDENARYEAAAEQFRFGCRSRIMYLEAYQILKQNPFLMRRLGLFELHLLRFSLREEILTAEIVRQTANLASYHEQFDPMLYEVLTAGYELYPSDDLVKAICLLLMKGNKKSAEYFPWYAKGVERGLRITGLYEFYMETMDCQSMEEMPQIIRMYFAYDHTLDYRRRAAMYRRITERKELDPQMYHNYRAAMEKFTLDQLEAVRISEDLAVLYRTFLRRSSLTRQSAEKLARLLFTYEVTCRSTKVVRILVHSERLVHTQGVAVQDGRAFVQIYDPDSVLIAVDGEGGHHNLSQLCEVRRVFEEEEMLAWCAQKVPEHPGIVLYLSVQCMHENLMNRNTLPYYCTACETEAFAEEFRETLRKMVLQYYLAHMREDSLPDFLDRISYTEYVKSDKAALITLLAEEGRCADAFPLLDAYGAEGIPLMRLVRICSRMVLDLEFEENTMLTALCYQCFESGKYDDKLLRYLLLYYEGSVREMIQVWQAARRFELDTMLLEEKILSVILFTRSASAGSEPVFESYLSKMGRRRICRAYCNLKAYEYFVKGQPVADSVFQYIEKEYVNLSRRNRLADQEEVCRLALMQKYSRRVNLTEEQKQYVSEFLEEFSAKGMRFAFWKRFDRQLILPYEMDGRVFVEYVGNPKSIVTLHYRIGGEDAPYLTETVGNCFEGIFVREFTLFYGEELECWLEEEFEGEKKKTDRRVLKADTKQTDELSRYSMLNCISRAQQENNKEKFQEETNAYLILEYLAKEVFTLV